LLSQVRNKNGTIELTALTEPLSAGLANRVQMLVSQLQDNVMYYAQVIQGSTSKLASMLAEVACSASSECLQELLLLGAEVRWPPAQNELEEP
jgi:hypothetical protein